MKKAIFTLCLLSLGSVGYSQLENGLTKNVKILTDMPKSKADFEVYSNLTQTLVTINYGDITNVRVYNFQGLLISESGENYLSVVNWSSGKYLIEVQNGEGELLHSSFVKY